MTQSDEHFLWVIAIAAVVALGMWTWYCFWFRLGMMHGKRNISGDQTGGDIVGRHNMGTITINGRTYTGNNISMSNGRVIIDGEDVTDQTGVDMKSILEVRVTGDIENIFCEKNITIMGNVKEYIDARGSVNCNDVGGDIKAGGSVNCDDVAGNVYANGSVNADDIGGSVQAGGSVRHG